MSLDVSFLDLSNELLDCIFEHCDKESIKSSRLTSKRLQKLANRHLIQELRIYYNKESLNLLSTLATTHQDIAKGIRAVWLQSDRLPEFTTYEAWDAERKKQYEDAIYSFTLYEDWFEEARAYGIDVLKISRSPRISGGSGSEKIAQDYLNCRYACYREMYTQQCELDSGNALREMSTAFFRACPKLHSIWVTSSGMVRVNSTHRSAAFRKGLIFPSDNNSKLHDGGIHCSSQFLLGALDAGVHLDTIVFGNVNYRFLTQDDKLMSRFKHMLGQVKRFQWQMGERIFSKDYDIDGFDDDEFDEMHAIFKRGQLAKFIANATDLETLAIGMPDIPHYMLDHVDFIHGFGESYFPLLQSLSITAVSTTPEGLADFLRLHKGTLKRLRLCSLRMEDGQDMTWQQWFSGIGGRLPHLENVSLRGGFFYGDEVTHMFGRGMSESMGTPLSRAMEAFMIHGGEGVPQPRDFPDNDRTAMEHRQFIEHVGGDAIVPEILPENWDVSSISW